MTKDRYPAVAFAICFAAYATSQMDLALFGYALPLIMKEFNLSLVQMMEYLALSFVLAGVLIVILGLLTDRLGRKGMFKFSLIGSSILVALHSVVPNPLTLSLLRGSSIAVGGLTYPITGAILTEELPAKGRGFILGLLQIGYPLGWVLASFWAAVLLSEQFGWRYLFLIGLVSIPLVVLVHLYLREPSRSIAARSQQRARIRDLFQPGIRGRALLLFFAQFFFVFAYAGSVFNFPSYLSEDRGFGSFEYSQVIGIGHAIGILGYVAAAFMGEYVITRRTTVIIWTLLGACMFQVTVWYASNYWQLIFSFGVMSMFFYGGAAVKFAYLAEVFPTRLRATAMASCGSLAVTLGSAAGPLSVAKAVEAHGWNVGFATLVGVPLVMAGLMYFFLKPIPSGLEVEEVDSLLSAKI